MKDPLPTGANPAFKLLGGERTPLEPTVDTFVLRMRALEAAHAIGELEKIARPDDVLKAAELEELAAARALSSSLSKGYLP